MNSQTPANNDIFQSISSQILLELKRLDFRTRRNADNQLAGAFRSSFKGTGLNFADFREYQPGDDIRRVHWTASARTNRVLVKDYEEERQCTFILAVDISRSTDYGWQKSVKQRIFEFASIIGLLAKKNQDRLGLLLFDSNPLLFIPPKATSRSQLMRVLYSLMDTQSTNTGTNISSALNELRLLQKKRSIVFLLSDFHDQKYETSLTQLAIKHEVICVQCRDTSEQEFPVSGIWQLKDAETGLIREVDLSSRHAKQALSTAFNTIEEQRRNFFRAKKIDYLNLGSNPVASLKELIRNRVSKTR